MDLTQAKQQAKGQPQALVVVMKHFFGLKPGQTLQEFSGELKSLTPEDRAEFTAYFNSQGIEIAGAPQAQC